MSYFSSFLAMTSWRNLSLQYVNLDIWTLRLGWSVRGGGGVIVRCVHWMHTIYDRSQVGHLHFCR